MTAAGLAAALLAVSVPAALAANPKRVFVVDNPTAYGAAEVIGGLVYLQIGPYHTAPAVASALTKNCPAAVVTISVSDADLILFARQKKATLTDRAGMVLFISHASMYSHIAKDVCAYITANP